EKQLMAWHKSTPVSQRLASVPGIGPIIATALAATVVEPSGFRSGREFAAWLGLVPRQNSTGGKHRLGGISWRGEAARYGPSTSVVQKMRPMSCGTVVPPAIRSAHDSQRPPCR